jgi:MerR family transcriptional regulator, heat shock protein HspR
MAGVPTPDADRGVYGITTAADLVGMGPQNLRLYEARGLLAPDRTDGGTRRYSAQDLDRLRRIGDLLDAGLNLAGIGMVLGLERENAQLRAEREERGWLPTARLHQTKRPTPNTPGETPPSKRTR